MSRSKPWVIEALAIVMCMVAFAIMLVVVLRSNGARTPTGTKSDVRSTVSAPSLRRSASNDDAERTDSLGRAPVEIHVRAPEVTPDLRNDASGPLFVETNMAPGTTTTRCVAVTNVGKRPADVRLFGAIDDGGLGRYLGFKIEVGKRARYGDCSLFSGRTVFDGSLARFGELHHDFATGMLVAKTVYPKTSVSFRLTQRLAESSPQGVHANARFAWEARTPMRPAPSSERAPEPPVAEPRVVAATQTPEPGLLDVVARAFVEVAKRGWSWILLLALVVLFLLIQDRIDRRDPRLAGARVYPERDLAFDQVLARSTHRSETNE